MKSKSCQLCKQIHTNYLCILYTGTFEKYHVCFLKMKWVWCSWKHFGVVLEAIPFNALLTKLHIPNVEGAFFKLLGIFGVWSLQLFFCFCDLFITFGLTIFGFLREHLVFFLGR